MDDLTFAERLVTEARKRVERQQRRIRHLEAMQADTTEAEKELQFFMDSLNLFDGYRRKIGKLQNKADQ